MDRESAYEMLQKVCRPVPGSKIIPAKGKEVAVDDGILGGLKDILFGTTGPRGGKKDGVVQTMAKSAARQVTNQIVRGMLGSLLGRKDKSDVICAPHLTLSPKGRGPFELVFDFVNNNKGAFAPLLDTIFSLTATG